MISEFPASNYDPLAEVLGWGADADEPKQASANGKSGDGNSSSGSTWLDEFITRHSLVVLRREPWNNVSRLILCECPFNPEHKGSSAALFVAADGMLGFKCQHNECAGKSWKDVREKFEPNRVHISKIAESAAAWEPQRESATPSSAALPRICCNGRQLRDISAEALQALQRANDPSVLFARGGSLVAVIRDEKSRQVITKVTESALRGRLARAANYFRVSKNRSESECPPAIEIVRDIQALEPSIWKFQPLDGVIEAPILRPDGSILDRPGYDKATMLYYAPDPNLRIPAIPEHPTPEHIKAAVNLIKQATGDFPFVDQASHTNAIAAMLTPIVRPAIDAPAPLALFDAPQAGTGKSLLSDGISIIATGRAGEMFSAPSDNEEWRKQITTALMSGTAVVIIDNVTRRLDNPDLCKVLTETIHADRQMRTHDKILLPVKSTWIATGNNIQVGGDMPRRCYWVRLDAKTSKPFMRSGFKIDNLKAWVLAHRGELLAALLTLARAWYARGCPKPAITPLGSYEAWSVTVGGILEHAGMKDFLANAGELYQEADAEAVQWEGFLTTLHQVFYSEPFTAGKIAEKLRETTWTDQRIVPSDAARKLREVLPDFIAEGVDRDGFFQRRTGKCFGERVDRRFGESQVHLKRGLVVNGSQQWKVVLPNADQQ